MEDSARLEDLMLAMDVVDTLRHRQQLVDRELNADDRRESLIEKLREIYTAQGIKVTDQLLADGVAALEEDRFKYTPPEKSFSSYFAQLYVIRDRWIKPVLIGLGIFLALGILFYLLMVRPQNAAEAALPLDLSQRYTEISQVAKEQPILGHALEIEKAGKFALKQKNYSEAQSSLDELNIILRQLKRVYRLRVVQEQGQRSGVWRIPDVNSRAKNYYLIVEAINQKGQVLILPVKSEETGKTAMVKRWGLRVEQSTFNNIAADKKDDGIIQKRQVGEKKKGFMQVEYSISTDGSTITDW